MHAIKEESGQTGRSLSARRSAMKPVKKSIQKHSNQAIHPGLRMLDFVDDGDWRLFHDEPSHPDDERLWRIKLIFHDEPELSGVARLLMALAEGLQAIPDVHVTVGDWGRGTLWAELKIQIGSLAAGKEVEKILSAARDGLLAKWLGSSVTDTEKKHAQAEKIRAEAAKIKAETQLLHFDAGSDLKRELELQKMDLENRGLLADIRRRELENQLLQLKIIQNASELIKQGLSTATPVEMRINDLPFISFDQNRPLSGADMVTIASAEAVPGGASEEPGSAR